MYASPPLYYQFYLNDNYAKVSLPVDLYTFLEITSIILWIIVIFDRAGSWVDKNATFELTRVTAVSKRSAFEHRRPVFVRYPITVIHNWTVWGHFIGYRASTRYTIDICPGRNPNVVTNRVLRFDRNQTKRSVNPASGTNNSIFSCVWLSNVGHITSAWVCA